MGKPRIKRRLGEFDSYLRTITTFFLETDPGTGVPNWQRLGLIQAEMTALSVFLALWFTGNPAAPGAYELHVNPDTKTKKTRKDVVKIMKDFIAFFQPLLNRISGAASLTDGDMLVLNIKKRSSTVSHQVNPITALINVISSAMGTCRLKFKFYSESEGGKPGFPEGANAVQTAVVVVDASATSSETSGKIKATAPKHAFDNTFLEIHQQAVITMEFSSVYAGKELYLYARYFNTRHPELAGPWCAVFKKNLPF